MRNLNVLQDATLPKPWRAHRVTVCIPHLDTPECLSLSVAMWQLQENRPFILVIDTGSTSDATAETLERVARDPAIEVAKLGILSEVEHRSDRVSIAMDYAFSRCPTEFLLAAHVDVFPKHRRLIDKLQALCSKDCPVVGWEMSPRGPEPDGLTQGALSLGIPGHACTMFHMPTMDRIGAGWSMRRAHHSFGLPRTGTEIAGWPDTEVCLGRILDEHGIRPLFLGRETNGENQETDDWIHARSTTVQQLLHGESLPRHTHAFREAAARLRQWEREQCIGATGPQPESEDSPMGLPRCHSRRVWPGDVDRLYCVHPAVHVRGQIVSPQVCGICPHWQEPAPERFRKLSVACDRRGSVEIPLSVGVIIEGDNGQSLSETLNSLQRQSIAPAEITVVVESASCVAETGSIPISRSVSSKDAFLATRSDVVCFLQAGDVLSPQSLEKGLLEFRDPRIGVAYPASQLSGDTGDVPSGAMVLREAIVMAGIFSDEDLGMGDGSRQLLQRVERFGWRTTKHGGRLHRPAIKTEQASANPIRDSCEWTRPTLTLAIPLSGRADLWPRMASFLERQTWPHDQLRLVLLDTSQVPIFSRTVREWLAQCDYVDVRYLHERVGLAGLADRPRRTAAGDVALAMTRIYNLLAREVTTAFVWFLEDDVFPPTDVCERLLESINNRTASVTAAYQSRLGAGVVAWDRFGSRLQGGTGLEQVAGNGFGCVLVRGEIVRETVFRCSANLPAYDSQFYSDLEHNGWIAKIDRSLRCEHAVDRAPELASDGLPLVSNRVLNLG